MTKNDYFETQKCHFWVFLCPFKISFSSLQHPSNVRRTFPPKTVQFSIIVTFLRTLAPVITLSSITELVRFPSNYFSDVNNWLNQTMVKWAWGWTLYSLMPFSMLLSCCMENGKYNCARAAIKIGVLGTAVWYVGTQITFRIGDVTGRCLDGNSSIIQ